MILDGGNDKDHGHGTGIPMNNRWFDWTWPNQIVILSNRDAKMMVVMIRIVIVIMEINLMIWHTDE